LQRGSPACVLARLLRGSKRLSTNDKPISPLLFFGFALVSNAPLAFVSLLPSTAYGSLQSAGLVILLTVAIYISPLLIWYRFSERIVTAGGLFAFVEQTVGRPIALVQAVVWSISYFLYLPYTVKEVVYDQLPVMFPGIGPVRWVLELVVPLVLIGLVFLPIRRLLILLGGVVVFQLVAMLILGFLQIYKVGVPLSSFGWHNGTDVAKGSANTALLFVCASLPLFLAGEVRGGSRTVRATLVGSYVFVAAYLVFTLFPLAKTGAVIHSEEFGGYDIALAYGDRALAIVVGLGTVLATATLIIAEYLALSRLLHYVLKRPVRQMVALIAVPFFVADCISLLNPDEFYDKLIQPSLFALFASQIFVFLAFPLYQRLRNRFTPADLVLAGVSTGLMVWGLYRVISSQVAS
jgi:amino acid transporter